MQLIELTDQFEELGINVASLTYDPVDFLKEVELDEAAEFPMLSDEDARHVKLFGVLNTDYEPGDRFYGIPYPGIFLIDADGLIVAKFAEQRYQDRPPFDDILAAAQAMD